MTSSSGRDKRQALEHNRVERGAKVVGSIDEGEHLVVVPSGGQLERIPPGTAVG